jgi:hypothetical protein
VENPGRRPVAGAASVDDWKRKGRRTVPSSPSNAKRCSFRARSDDLDLASRRGFKLLNTSLTIICVLDHVRREDGTFHEIKSRLA